MAPLHENVAHYAADKRMVLASDIIFLLIDGFFFNSWLTDQGTRHLAAFRIGLERTLQFTGGGVGNRHQKSVNSISRNGLTLNK